MLTIYYMITNFLKNGFQSLESITNIGSIQNNHNSANNKNNSAQPNSLTPISTQKIVQETISVLVNILSDKLGQKIEGAEIKELTTDVMKSKSLESSLIQAKQRYNDLVNKSTTLYQQARKISNSIGQFITSINLFLQSQELLVPLKQIQKGISELQAQKVEKQFNYLIKIFTNNFQEVIDKSVKIAETNMNEEVKLLKSLNKNLEQQIISVKNNKGNDQSKYLEQAMKITALNQKIVKLSSERSDSQKQQKVGSSILQEKIKVINEQEKEINRLKQKQNDLLQKIKQMEYKSVRLQRQYKQHSNEAQSLNTVIQKLKLRHEEIVEELESESRKKDMQHQAIRKKLFNQKSVLQEKNEQLKELLGNLQQNLANKQTQLTKLKAQLAQYKEQRLTEIDFSQMSKKVEQNAEQNSSKIEQKQNQQQENLQPGKRNKMTIKEIIQKINELQKENDTIKTTLAKEKQLGANKQVLRGLFISYDDQSKEWNVRRNIKYQIYSLLDMKDKLPKPQEPKTGKWFGMF